jgi:hypothetical protein
MRPGTHRLFAAEDGLTKPLMSFVNLLPQGELSKTSVVYNSFSSAGLAQR